MAVGLVLLVLGFFQRHLVDLRARWRVAVAASSFALVIWDLSVSTFRGYDLLRKIIFSVPMGFAAAVGTFVILIAAEVSVRRVAPAKLVSLARLFTRAATSEACGLAILRGTCVGTMLLGANTFLVWLGTSYSRMYLDGFQHISVQTLWFLSSPWASAHVLHGLSQAGLSAVGCAFLICFVARLARRYWLGVLVAAIFSALISPAQIISSGPVQPYYWKALLIFFSFLVMALAFTWFDVLTLAWVLFTFIFCWENYYLLVMLTPAGMLEPWIAFAVFGLFVLAGAAITFKSSLRAARRRLATAFE